MKAKFNMDKVVEAYSKKTKTTPNVRELASEFGLTHTTLYNMQKGKGLEKIESIFLMIEKTGLSFNQIFTENEN